MNQPGRDVVGDFAEVLSRMFFCRTGKGNGKNFQLVVTPKKNLTKHDSDVLESYIKPKSRSGMLHLTKGCHVFDWEMLQTLGY